MIDQTGYGQISLSEIFRVVYIVLVTMSVHDQIIYSVFCAELLYSVW